MTNQGDNQDPYEDEGVEDDFEKTRVPSETPTVDGISDEDCSSDEDGTDHTWVPTSAPTHDGVHAPDSGDGQDADRTNAAEWEANGKSDDGLSFNDGEISTDRTVAAPEPSGGHGELTADSDRAEDEEEQPGFDATVVASVDGAPPAEAEESVFERTVVVPVQDDLSSQTVVADPGMPVDRTVVVEMDSDLNESSSAVLDTVMSDDGGHHFSKTVGMRGMSAEELEQYEAERNEKATVVVEGENNSPNSTQIWSRQSSGGLDTALKIRSGQVGGNSHITSESDGKPDYEVLEKLAEGGMGTIYVASQTSLDREIAIKTLKPLKPRELKAYQSQGRLDQVVRQRREMFLAEALVTANLVHPHIVPIHDLCETDEAAPFYVMKRVRGTPWNEKITELTQEENLQVLHKTCDAMAYAHHNGVINRDLKPENIMIIPSMISSDVFITCLCVHSFEPMGGGLM